MLTKSISILSVLLVIASALLAACAPAPTPTPVPPAPTSAPAVAAAPANAPAIAHIMVTPNDLKWTDVPSLPKGAKIAVIEGPLTEAVPFTVRLKLPADYQIPAHWHPAIERVTVLSGTFNIGMGDKLDTQMTTALGAGGVIIMQPKTNHFVWTKEETIVQLNGTGPWGITYVNPADDPRKQ